MKHESEVFAVAWSPDESQLASASRDRTIRLWNLPGGAARAVVEAHRGAARDVAFSPDGAWLASAGGDATVKLWQATHCAAVATLTGHGGVVGAVAWSLDGMRLASAGAFWTFSEIKLWAMPDGAEIATLRTGKGELAFDVAFDADGSRIAAGLAPGLVRVWNAESGAELVTLRAHGETVRALAFGPDSRLVTASSDGALKLWSADFELLRALKGHTGAARAVAWSPDGARIASGSGDQSARVWDAATGRELAVFAGHEGPVHAVAWSPDGTQIATGSGDGHVRVWALG